MEGYKGFYKTDNKLIVKDTFSQQRIVGEKYFLDDDRKIKYGGDTEGFNFGHGFHFSNSISNTMPHFRMAITSDEYVAAKIETFGEVVESKIESGCYATRGYQIIKLLNHSDIINVIENNISSMESVKILGHYSCIMRDIEKKRILNVYNKLLKKYAENFEENWLNIYCLYEGIMFLTKLEYEYYNTDDKKGYAKKLIKNFN